MTESNVDDTKFQCWDPTHRVMIPWKDILSSMDLNLLLQSTGYHLLQYIGVRDSEGEEYYVGDIGRFPNGDTFEVKREGWLQASLDFTGDPKCEEQGRDLYRASKAVKIGDIRTTPHLLD